MEVEVFSGTILRRRCGDEGTSRVIVGEVDVGEGEGSKDGGEGSTGKESGVGGVVVVAV